LGAWHWPADPVTLVTDRAATSPSKQAISRGHALSNPTTLTPSASVSPLLRFHTGQGLPYLAFPPPPLSRRLPRGYLRPPLWGPSGAPRGVPLRNAGRFLRTAIPPRLNRRSGSFTSGAVTFRSRRAFSHTITWDPPGLAFRGPLHTARPHLRGVLTRACRHTQRHFAPRILQHYISILSPPEQSTPLPHSCGHPRRITRAIYYTDAPTELPPEYNPPFRPFLPQSSQRAYPPLTHPLATRGEINSTAFTTRDISHRHLR